MRGLDKVSVGLPTTLSRFTWQGSQVRILQRPPRFSLRVCVAELGGDGRPLSMLAVPLWRQLRSSRMDSVLRGPAWISRRRDEQRGEQIRRSGRERAGEDERRIGNFPLFLQQTCGGRREVTAASRPLRSPNASFAGSSSGVPQFLHGTIRKISKLLPRLQSAQVSKSCHRFNISTEPATLV